MMIDINGATGYSRWATQMLHMSAGVDDTNKVLVPMVVKTQIPLVLHKFVKTPKDFTDLVKQIQEVDHTLLSKKLKKKQGQRVQEAYITQMRAADTAQ